MIRTFFLAVAVTLALGATAQADGFEQGREQGYGAPRLHRAVHAHRQHHVRRYLPRRAYRPAFVGGVEPGRLTDNPNVPIYNIPPKRFP